MSSARFLSALLSPHQVGYQHLNVCDLSKCVEVYHTVLMRASVCLI